MHLMLSYNNLQSLKTRKSGTIRVVRPCLPRQLVYRLARVPMQEELRKQKVSAPLAAHIINKFAKG